MKSPTRSLKVAPTSSRTERARADGLQAIYALWDELGLFPAHRTEEALVGLATGLTKLLAADNVRWLAAVRVLPGSDVGADELLGWRLRASYDLVPDPEAYTKLVAWWYRRDHAEARDVLIGHAARALVAGAGIFRAHRMRDGWIPFKEFQRSEHYRLHYTELGITDRIWLSVPLTADAESVFLIDRVGGADFSDLDVELATTALRGVHGFHRRLFLSHGLLVATEPMSPTARRIVSKLLTGLSEKEIAETMNQSFSTTHKYVTEIYNRFGVRGRAAMMALWLGGG